MRVFEAVCLVIVIVCLLLAFALLRKTAEVERQKVGAQRVMAQTKVWC